MPHLLSDASASWLRDRMGRDGSLSSVRRPRPHVGDEEDPFPFQLAVSEGRVLMRRLHPETHIYLNGYRKSLYNEPRTGTAEWYVLSDALPDEDETYSLYVWYDQGADATRALVSASEPSGYTSGAPLACLEVGRYEADTATVRQSLRAAPALYGLVGDSEAPGAPLKSVVVRADGIGLYNGGTDAWPPASGSLLLYLKPMSGGGYELRRITPP